MTETGYLNDADIEEIIKGYEQQFGMSSAEFQKRWIKGQMPDTFDTMAWAILLDTTGYLFACNLPVGE